MGLRGAKLGTPISRHGAATVGGLLSPTGVPHDVPNLEALKDLASKTPGLVVARKNLLAMLVGVNDTEALIKR